MTNKLMRLGLVLGLLISSMALPQAASAVTWGTCTSETNNHHKYLRLDAGSLKVNYMQADIASVKDVKSCGPGTSGASFVLPVNIQGYAFVQLGYARFANGDLNWVYTPDESATVPGTMIAAPSSVPDPIYLHSYRLTVWYNGDADMWRYRVEDVTAGTSYMWSGVTATKHYGYEIWAGFEVYNANSQLGGEGSCCPIQINDVGYQIENSSTTSYITSSTTYECCGADKTWWHVASGRHSNSHGYINAWTTDH